MKRILTQTPLLLIVLAIISGCSYFDSEPPIITYAKGDTIEIAVHSSMNLDEYAQAEDDYSQDVSVMTDDFVDLDTLGEYSITLYSLDERGNRSEVPFLVKVVDNVSPEISIVGDEYLVLAIGETFEDPGIQVKDNDDENPVISLEGEVDTQRIGTYTLTYMAEDASGNVAEAARRIDVKDFTPPVLTIIGESHITVPYGSVYEEVGVNIIDNVDKEIAVKVLGEVDSYRAGDYKLTYIGTDQSGNTAESSRVVTVEPLTNVDGKGVVWQIMGISTHKDDMQHSDMTFTMFMRIDNQSSTGIMSTPFMNFTDHNGFPMLKMMDLYLVPEFDGVIPPGEAYDMQIDVGYDGDFQDLSKVTEIRYDFSTDHISYGQNDIIKVDFKSILEAEMR